MASGGLIELHRVLFSDSWSHTFQATRRGLKTGSKPLNSDGFLIEKRWFFDGFAEGTGVECGDFARLREQGWSVVISRSKIIEQRWFFGWFC